jgi:hypothetical protein
MLVTSLAGPALAQAPSGAANVGIKVHGHWTLVIRNDDGTVASRHEFENALLGPGATLLAQLLAGSAAAGPWLVFLHPASPGPGCNSVNNACSISGPNSGLGTESHDLAVSVPASGPNAGKLVLRGSVRIPTAQAITEVGTNVVTCAGSTAAGSCVVDLATAQVAFTGRGFTPIPVAADQTVDVTVVISFS